MKKSKACPMCGGPMGSHKEPDKDDRGAKSDGDHDDVRHGGKFNGFARKAKVQVGYADGPGVGEPGGPKAVGT